MEQKKRREAIENHVKQTLFDMREGRTIAVKQIREENPEAEWFEPYLYMHGIADELTDIIIKIMDKEMDYDLRDKTVSILFATVKGITTGKMLDEIRALIDVANKRKEQIKSGLMYH